MINDMIVNEDNIMCIDDIVDKNSFLSFNDDIYHGSSSNWKFFNGGWYYVKFGKGLNELIGESLADYMNMNTSHNILIRDHGYIMTASMNFCKYDCKYYRIDQLIQSYDKLCGSDFLELLKYNNHIDYENVESNILKMFCLDIFMIQLDRCEVNLLFEKDTTGVIRFAPLFDYSDALGRIQHVYNNCVCDIKLNRKFMETMYLKYPKMYKYMEKISNASLMKIVDDICKQYDLKLKDYVMMDYEETECKSKKLIKSLL